MLIGGGEHKEGLLLESSFDLIRTSAFQIVDFTFSEDKGSCFHCSLLESDASCHVFDILDDEVNRDSVISESWNDNICVD